MMHRLQTRAWRKKLIFSEDIFFGLGFTDVLPKSYLQAITLANNV